MTNDQIQSFLLQKGKYLPKGEINIISSRLVHLEERRVPKVLSTSTKNPIVFTLLYWLLWGFFLIDRFFTGQYISGLVKLIYPILFFVFFSRLENIKFPIMVNEKDYLNLAIILFCIYPLWILIDGFTINSRIKHHNFRKLKRVL